GPLHLAAISHVAHDQLRLAREVGRGAIGMDLGVEAVENTHRVPRRQQAVDDERPDEASAPGDQDVHAAGRSTLLRRAWATSARGRLLCCNPATGRLAPSRVKLSVVIPARNEAANIRPTLDALRARLAGEGIEYELVVVDDGSSDATPDEVESLAVADPGVRLVRNTGAHRFGHAVRCGRGAFTGDAVAIVMADGSDSPDDLVRYYYVLRDRAECAFGSRFAAGSEVIDYPRFKLFVNRLAAPVS